MKSYTLKGDDTRRQQLMQRIHCDTNTERRSQIEGNYMMDMQFQIHSLQDELSKQSIFYQQLYKQKEQENEKLIDYIFKLEDQLKYHQTIEEKLTQENNDVKLQFNDLLEEYHNTKRQLENQDIWKTKIQNVEASYQEALKTIRSLELKYQMDHKASEEIDYSHTSSQKSIDYEQLKEQYDRDKKLYQQRLQDKNKQIQEQAMQLQQKLNLQEQNLQTIKQLNEEIRQLRTQLNDLREENDQLRRPFETLKTECEMRDPLAPLMSPSIKKNFNSNLDLDFQYKIQASSRIKPNSSNSLSSQLQLNKKQFLGDFKKITSRMAGFMSNQLDYKTLHTMKMDLNNTHIDLTQQINRKQSRSNLDDFHDHN